MRIKQLYEDFVKISLETCISPSAGSGNLARIYTFEQLKSINGNVISMAMGSGNPTNFVNFHQGDFVVDMGCGIGMDCFLASKIVGPNGFVLGIDITSQIINLAHSEMKKMNTNNLYFINGDMQLLPIKSEIVDVVMGNFSLSCLPQPEFIFHEIFRVLKQGASVCISDMILNSSDQNEKKPSLIWPFSVANIFDADLYISSLKKAGFSEISIHELGTIQINQGRIQSITISGKKPIQ